MGEKSSRRHATGILASVDNRPIKFWRLQTPYSIFLAAGMKIMASLGVRDAETPVNRSLPPGHNQKFSYHRDADETAIQGQSTSSVVVPIDAAYI